MKPQIISRRGFTLVEMLVVIAIIVILTGIIMTDLMSSKSKARDAKRVSDIAQIQLSLEQYFDRCGQYPQPNNYAPSTSPVSGDFCPTNSSVTLGTYISVMPTPPSNATKYDYYVNGSPATDYILHVQLENYNDVVKDSLQAPLDFGINSNCWNGATTAPADYCVGPK